MAIATTTAILLARPSWHGEPQPGRDHDGLQGDRRSFPRRPRRSPGETVVVSQDTTTVSIVVPMLLIPSHEDQHTLIAYNVLNNEFLGTQLSLPYGKRFGGSSEGWLVAVEENFSITLYKPFSIVKEGSRNNTDHIIRLPCLFPLEPYEDYLFPLEPYEYDYHVFKTIITADPLEIPNNCIVPVIFSDMYYLSFIRLGKDTAWIRVDVRTVLQFETFHDITYYNDRFYDVHFSG
ncbi:hypothetical protein TIFTF001_040480 [Ficus carica]|uniref:KIB1-4 beta-propeller domain-containing protein n=1 Tax=Ficus carica TaxID=3494 RepID=A0AA88D0N2_FICCA|nr:hypothetical protein TIFTF001_040480 [Ficus carica]